MTVESLAAKCVRELRAAGYLVQVVERWNAFAGVRQDLYGIVDVLAVHPEKVETLGVQVTSHANLYGRLKKLREHKSTAVLLSGGWRLEVWGWRKKGRRWEVTRKELGGI